MKNSSLDNLKTAYIQKYGNTYNDEWFEDFDSAFIAAWQVFEDSLLSQSAIIQGMSKCWSLRQPSFVQVKVGNCIFPFQVI
jgi:hypothetical protein